MPALAFARDVYARFQAFRIDMDMDTVWTTANLTILGVDLVLPSHRIDINLAGLATKLANEDR